MPFPPDSQESDAVSDEEDAVIISEIEQILKTESIIELPDVSLKSDDIRSYIDVDEISEKPKSAPNNPPEKPISITNSPQLDWCSVGSCHADNKSEDSIKPEDYAALIESIEQLQDLEMAQKLQAELDEELNGDALWQIL